MRRTKACLNTTTVFPDMRIPIIKIRRSWHLYDKVFILVGWHIHIKMAPWWRIGALRDNYSDMIHWVKAVLLSLGPNCLFDYLVNYVSCTHLSMNCSLFVIEIAKQAASLAVMWPGDRKLMLSRQKCVSPKCEIGYLSNPVLLTHIQFLEKSCGNHRISAFCHALLSIYESNSFPKITLLLHYFL